jgi:hypothetical protein
MSSSTASNCALCHNQRRARRDETSKEKVSITPLGSPLPLGEGEGDRGQPPQRRLSEIGPIDQASIFRKFSFRRWLLKSGTETSVYFLRRAESEVRIGCSTCRSNSRPPTSGEATLRETRTPGDRMAIE